MQIDNKHQRRNPERLIADMTRRTSSSASRLSDLRSKHIIQLSKLLNLPPKLHPANPTWLQGQATTISTLSGTLLRPTAPLLRFAMRLPSSLVQATLCKTHKPLNPYLIHSTFLALSAETTTRLVHLVHHPTIPLPPHIHMFLRRFQSLSSLWMSPEAYRVTFQAQPHEARHERIENDCEACILARVGGDEQMLCDLRATLLGRRKKSSPEPELKGLVEAWIDGLDGGRERREQIYEMSARVGKDLRSVRREMQLLRRRKKAEMRGEGKASVKSPTLPSQSQFQPRTQESDETPLISKQTKNSWNSNQSTLTSSPPLSSPWTSSTDSELEAIHEADSKERNSHSNESNNERRPHLGSEDDDHHFEGSIIDYYAASSSASLTDSTSLRPTRPRKYSNTNLYASSSTNAANYRNPIVSDRTSRNSAKRSQNTQARAPQATRDPLANPINEDLPPLPLPPKRTAYQKQQPPPPPTYTASIYSRDTNAVDDIAAQPTSGLLNRRDAEEQADEYRRLVKIAEEEEEQSFTPSPPRRRRTTTATGSRMKYKDRHREEEDEEGGENLRPLTGLSGRSKDKGKDKSSRRDSQSTHWTDFYD